MLLRYVCVDVDLCGLLDCLVCLVLLVYLVFVVFPGCLMCVLV